MEVIDSGFLGGRVEMHNSLSNTVDHAFFALSESRELSCKRGGGALSPRRLGCTRGFGFNGSSAIAGGLIRFVGRRSGFR
jgi:hypothetical protein